MKKLITKVGVVRVDCRVPDKLYFENEGISEIDNYLVTEVSDETFSFLNNIAIIENSVFGEKVWKVNNIEFREYNELEV